MRLIFLVLVFGSFSTFAQIPSYHFVDLLATDKIPANLNSSRSAVIVTVPNLEGEFVRQGKWQLLVEQAHGAFVTMKVDPVLYVNHQDILGNAASNDNYLEIFSKRKIANFIFLTQISTNEFEIVITKNLGEGQLLKNGQPAYTIRETSLKSALLSLGKEIRRAELDQGNFLIPEKPSFLSGMSIVGNTQLKNYPGILRRSSLAVERFAKIPEIKSDNSTVNDKIASYNSMIDAMNDELESILQLYPFDFEIIDPMSDEDLLRNRHQYVLRSATGSVKSVREILEFSVSDSESAYVSVIPIMPDRTTVKSIPQDALVTKYYVRQNITKNVHVGEWDADVDWQSALKNMIGNLTQRLKNKN